MSINETPQAAPRTGRVLLVDDEADLGRAYARILSKTGLTVTTAISGPEGLEQLSQQDFDVILSDISMPSMSGVALLRAVRDRYLDLPVVLMTGSPSLDTAIQAVEYGATQYVLKPVMPKVLTEVVWRAVDLHRLALLRREVDSELPGTQLGDRASIESRFALALEGLWIAYQPIVCCSGKSTLGYEALVRTTEASLARPPDFFDAAERLHRLHDLGRAIRRRIAFEIESGPDCLTFINVHSQDLNDKDLIDPDSPLSRVASRVVIEVTERSTLDDVSGLALTLSKLRELGYRIAIDDLGAGYAGLSSFARLEPEFVKLDMSLIRNIDLSARKRSLVKGMAKVCSHDLGMQVICEGVERTGELDVLVEDGLDLFQGHLFAKPAARFPLPRW